LGRPSVRPGVLPAHLTLKRWRRGADGLALAAAAAAFLAAYEEVAGAAADDAHLARMLGCLLLARIEGDSPADYLADLDIAAVRRRAGALLLEPPRRLGGSVFLTEGS
jgi:hypothetical protein